MSEQRNRPLRLSPLGHTWLFDHDGTIVKHNGWKEPEGDTLLDGARQMLAHLPEGDTIIFLTSRTEEQREMTEGFLKRQGIRYDHILFGLPYGERIVVNDRKPSGLETALAVNTDRDVCWDGDFLVDEGL